MHRRPAVVVFAAGNDVEAALEPIETTAIEVVLEGRPRIAGAEIEIAEHHAAQVRQVGDAAWA